MTERRRPTTSAPVLDYSRLAERMDKSDAAVVARVETLFDELSATLGDRLRRIEGDVAALRQGNSRDQARFVDLEEQIARTREGVIAELRGQIAVPVEKVASGVAEGVARGTATVSTKHLWTLGGIAGAAFVFITQVAPWIAKGIGAIVMWAKLNAGDPS